MENGKKIALAVSAAFVIAIGVRVGLIYKANHEDVPVATETSAKPKLSDDDMVFLRKQHPDSLKDEQALIGKTIWVSAGGQMDYYKDTGKHVDYAKPVGVLLGAEPLIIRDVFEEKAPASSRAVFRIAPGQRQVLLGFTMPNSTDP